MPTRLIIAYALIAALIVFGTGVVLWLRYHSHARVHARQRRRRLERDELAKAAWE